MSDSPSPPLDAATTDARIRATCAVLETVAMQYPKDSAEREAVKEAALAFSYLQLHETLKAAYAKHREQLRGPMTEEKLEILRRMGVEVE